MLECTHLDQIRDVTPSAEGCEDCLRIGSSWVHLRLCLTCGHPIVRSLEPGEEWAWCYVDQVVLEPAQP